MAGLGVGARSYTRRVHYGSDYAVAARAVESVIERWVARDDFSHAEHGFVLDDDEQRRRWMLLGLFGDGVDRAAYRARFGADVLEHVPELRDVIERGFATDEARITLTESGLERSDAIGPFLVSAAVRARMEAWEPR
jgi:oxygen-independent coproporphyrinogen-3 oxidase